MSVAVILAVDDDPVNLHIIESTFEDSGFDLRFADSGKRALEVLDEESLAVDLVILDRMMPGMDGLEVLRRIKANPRLARTPVVMQTAAAAPEQVAEGLRAGAHYYLTKPYAPAALRTIVWAALEDIRHRREVEARSMQQLDVLRFTTSASFVFSTLDQAGELAGLLASLCPEPRAALMGFSELLLNAIEHGNLAISYHEKSQLKREDRWREEVDRRSLLPEYRDRRVRVAFERGSDTLDFQITDEGDGFAWEKYLELDSTRVFDPNGRGIALAKALSFSHLHYEGRGNIAVASVALGPSPPPHSSGV